MTHLFNPRLRLRHLQCLVALAAHRSVLKAADALSHTPSAISKSLAELENIVGASLFSRRRSGLQLTPVGETLVSAATQAFGALHEGFGALEDGRNTNEQINIGVLPTAAASLLPAAILGHQADFPQVAINVYTGLNHELMKRLKSHELDLVLGRLPDPVEMFGVSFEALYTESMVMAVRPQHPLSKIRPTISEIAGFPIILPLSGSSIRQAAESFFISAGSALPRHQISTLSETVARTLMHQSDGIWFIPYGVVASDVAEGVAAQLQIDTRSTNSAVGLSSLSEGPSRKLVGLFADRIRALAAQMRTQRLHSQVPEIG